MKIKYFEIEKYNQFKDFKLDLTYPEGHEKAGQALEKVCFIGQSGTGKTTLLELLYLCYENHLNVEFFNTYPTWSFKKFTTDSSGNFLHSRLYLAADRSKTSLSLRFFQGLPIPGQTMMNLSINNSLHTRAWGEIKKLIGDYQRKRTAKELEIAREFNGGNLELAEEKRQSFLEWEQSTPSPLVHIAELFLNPILANFNLKVKTLVESEEEAHFINLIDFKGNTIPREFWSTGIEHLIRTILPIYSLETPNIIFIDEPETSLYPDIQEVIVDSCVKIAKPGSQLFFATHSPIIASRFEPWEIVHLVFDKDYNVVQRPFYDTTKERHVDNYTIDPRLLRWDDVLQKVFQMKEEGNSEERTPKLMELATMESKIKKLKAQGNANGELTKLWEEYKKLAELLDWETTMP